MELTVEFPLFDYENIPVHFNNRRAFSLFGPAEYRSAGCFFDWLRFREYRKYVIGIFRIKPFFDARPRQVVSLTSARRYAVVGSLSYFEGNPQLRVPTDLLRHTCLRTRLPNGAIFRWRFETDGEPLQLDIDGPITLDEASLARIAVLNSVGIGFFMEADVREDIAAARLVRVLEDWTPPLSPLCLYYPSRRNPPASFQLFVDLARELSRTR